MKDSKLAEKCVYKLRYLPEGVLLRADRAQSHASGSCFSSILNNR